MRWKGRSRSSNVDDSRGRGSSGFGRSGGGLQLPMGKRAGGGGMGIGTMIIIGIVLWFLGINPLTLLGGGLGGDLAGGFAPQTQSPRTQTAPRTTPTTDDEQKRFVQTILASTEQVWTKIFADFGKQYTKPVVNLFTGRTNSGCGLASAASGPFYCPADNEVYIDLDFYRELETKFGASGDFAEAYVLAHEVGHHVQNVIGVLPQFNKMRRSMGKLEVNRMSVKVELQADCFAGVWGYYVNREGWLDEGDLEEALNAATQIGDDAIQKRTQGYVVPESFNHGTSEQRRYWFKRGFDSGRMESCDTFKARNLS